MNRKTLRSGPVLALAIIAVFALAHTAIHFLDRPVKEAAEAISASVAELEHEKLFRRVCWGEATVPEWTNHVKEHPDGSRSCTVLQDGKPIGTLWVPAP